MKCPRCGHWNQPSFPRCFKCGAPLEPSASPRPAWRDQFSAPSKDKIRVLYDDADAQPTMEEFAAAGKKADNAPASLPEEMKLLHERRARGEQFLSDYRSANEQTAESRENPSGVHIRHSGEEEAQAADAGYSDAGANDAYQAGRIGSEGRYASGDAEDFLLPEDDDDFFEGYDDPYNEIYDDSLPPTGPAVGRPHRRKRRMHRSALIALWIVRILLVGVAVMVGLAGWTFAKEYFSRQAQGSPVDALIETCEVGGHPGHRITIPAAEGTQCYISELTKSYVAVNGRIVIEVADHVFYNDIRNLEAASMTVQLTPTMLYQGSEERKSPITYDIDIPASMLVLLTPETTWLEVTTSVYNIRLQVTPGSQVIINNTDITDTVNDSGIVDYNPVIQAIGDNIVSITARAPYCRETRLVLTLYREPMSIPIELDPDVQARTSDGVMSIKATTRAGATITVETPYESVDTTELDATGKFIVRAKMTRVGYNDITIRASYPGKEDSTLTHTVYYLPTAAVYTPKAWALNPSDYQELMNNIKMRIEKAQIYECKGKITQIISEKPQIAIMDTGTGESEQPVMLQNETATTWVLGESYRIYADVSGIYGSMPKLTARYTYPY